MSGATGSTRYMAPEVAKSEPYSLSADLYSYGTLLWEVLSLDRAYWDLSMEEHTARVIEGNERPKLSRKWPNAIRELLQVCWHSDCNQRPLAKQIQKLLGQELETFAREHNIRIQVPSGDRHYSG
mmetsp:Transcript_11856/g.13185  ORF Transcript_11856/g.13185 Transcript_11856/m.13185 type:complete len:125 (+) Transcript_11856:900-1274(+)